MKSEQPHESLKIDNHHISRRSFLGTTAAGSAALLTGGLATLFKERAFAGSSFPFVEATIPQLQAAMTNGQLTSKDLTMGYLNRIASLNPTLHAVIETNANAVSIASSLDNERSHGMVRGPLHGIPILVKDNIATLDNMQTTAGSVAIYGNQVPADAPLIQNLRAAGAIILGKANLGEWANFRDDEAETYPLAVGWSARGGSTNNAYDLSYTSWGSSSGSGAGAAANLCAAAVGTETDGSITGPSAVENIFGLKPTLGLISQDGIVPISHQQDAAGPMARSVTDVAILLGIMQSPQTDYTPLLQRGALQGKRIGRDVRYFDYSYYGSGIPGDEETVAFANHALDVMASLARRLWIRTRATYSRIPAMSSPRCCMNSEPKSRITSRRLRTQPCGRWLTSSRSTMHIVRRSWFTTTRTYSYWRNSSLVIPTIPITPRPGITRRAPLERELTVQ